MARQKPNSSIDERERNEILSGHIRSHLITFGLNRMEEVVQVLAKWLVNKPSEQVTVVSSERLPAERVVQLFSIFGVETRAIRSKPKLSQMSAYVLTLPPLCERLEDLPLITEFIIAEHQNIYSGGFPGIHPSYLPVLYYLCHEYYSPNGLTTPLLTEDKFVGFLRKAIIEKIIARTVFERVQFQCQLNDFEETKSGLRSFTLLEDEFIGLPPNSTFENSRHSWINGETDTEISIRSDPRTGRMMGACAHVRSISSEEFTFFLKNSNLSKKDQSTQRLIKLNSLQSNMIRCGSKCIPLLSRLKATPISDIFNMRKKALDTLSRMIGSAATSPNFDDKKFRIFDDDNSVRYQGIKYCLPEKHYIAVKHIAEQKKRGNLTLNKRSVYEFCFGDYDHVPKSIRRKSVRKWFSDNGGHAKRFVEDGLLKTPRRGECEIPVPSDLIDILPVIDID